MEIIKVHANNTLLHRKRQ